MGDCKFDKVSVIGISISGAHTVGESSCDKVSVIGMSISGALAVKIRSGFINLLEFFFKH